MRIFGEAISNAVQVIHLFTLSQAGKACAGALWSGAAAQSRQVAVEVQEVRGCVISFCPQLS